MTYNFSTPDQAHIRMKDYSKFMLEDFPVQFTLHNYGPLPWPSDLHATGTSPKLPLKEAQIFHTFTAKGLLLCK